MRFGAPASSLSKSTGRNINGAVGIPASALSHHPSLRRLEFEGCTMPPLCDLAGYTQLHGLRELVCGMSLNAPSYQLQHVQPLSQLEVLDVWGMQNAGADGALEALPWMLWELSLSGSDLRTVPASMASLTRLTRLALSDSQVNDGWQHLPPQLENLNLRSMLGLSTVPPELSRLSRLTELDLSCNVELEGGLEALSHLSSMQKLDLRGCRLGDAGLAVALPRALQSLDLTRTRLTAIPAALSVLTGLTSLRLNRNRLSGGWQHLASMQQLATVSLIQCKLAAVPEVLSQLTTLTSLDMRYNAIASGWQHLSLLARLRELRTDKPAHGIYLA